MHLKDLGCTYVEIGHAERRKILKEDDNMINKKVIGCLRNKLIPILCIGEEKKYKDINLAYQFLEKQLTADLKEIKPDKINNIVIAYEPIWAIGASRAAPIEHTYGIIEYIRLLLRKKYGEYTSRNQLIIYGGAVNPESAKKILKLKNNNGIFIGRAGLDFNYFIEMIKMAIKIQGENNKN